MASFHRFPALPPELRIEIWRQHFAVCHGTQIHVFLSNPPDADTTQSQGPKYVNLDAATHDTGYDTLGAAKVSAEAWAVFKESFHVGDTSCLSPQNALLDSGGRLVDYDPETDDQPGMPGGSMRGLCALAAQEELRRQSVRFAMDCEQDMVYIVDREVLSLFRALCATSWMQKVKRVAFQVLHLQNHRHPTHPRQLDQWAQWDIMLGNPTVGVEKFFNNPAFKAVLLVVVPNEYVGDSYSNPNIYGFVPLRPLSFTLGTIDDTKLVRNHFRTNTVRLWEAYPHLLTERKIGYMADVIPSRSKFSI
jgi:hypothetical protein